MGPVVVGTTLESLEARPARRFRVGIAGRGISGERRWDLAPAAGGTRVAGSIHLESRSRVGRVFLRLGRAGIGPRLEAELATLKQRSRSGREPTFGARGCGALTCGHWNSVHTEQREHGIRS